MADSVDKEARIVRMLRDNDSSASKALYCAYARYLTGVCTRYMSNSDDVNDVLHDSFIKIFNAIHSFKYRGNGSLRAWLTKIVVNESLKFIKQTYRFDITSLSDETEEIPIEEEPRIESLSIDILYQMICELPTGYRTVFNLYVFEKKSHKEIASLLNIKEASSASQLHRAKAILAEKIKNYQSNNPRE